MGASISCSLFESFSTALHWFVREQSANENILHYLDDYLFGGYAGKTHCSESLSMFTDCCSDWGVPLAGDKTFEPTENLAFLGIAFDTSAMIMRTPVEKSVN